jgi:hypothetical protein
MSRSGQSYGTSSNDQVRALFSGLTSLEEFLGEDLFVERMTDARWGIIREFQNACSTRDGRETPGYIDGLDDEPSSIVTRLLHVMSAGAQNRVFSVEDLSSEYRNGSCSMHKLIVDHVRYEVFMRTVLIMCDVEHSLYYEGGDWALPPTVLDRYLLRFQAAGRDSYRDNRRWHGRPDSARRVMKSLGFAPGGVSCGVS